MGRAQTPEKFPEIPEQPPRSLRHGNEYARSMARGRNEAGSPVTRPVVAPLVLLGLLVLGAGSPTEPRLSLDPTRDFAGSRVNAQASGFLPYEELT